MSTYKSAQYTNQTATPQTFNQGHEMGPRLVKFFSYTVPTGGITTSDTLQLVSIPKGAVLLGGKLAHDGLGNSIVVGDGTTADKYKDATSVASAGELFFNNTLALNFGEEVASEFVLTAAPSAGSWTQAKILKGFITYRMKQ